MIPLLLILAQTSSAQPAASGSETAPELVVTASRVLQAQEETPASATVIDSEQIERLGMPLGDSLLRLTPSAAVAVSGPSGSLTEVRIRGAEANHTLLFIDGIRANDPAAGNTPRFELLNADIVSHLEVVRGPQSALWGSEAIGGVVAVNGVTAPSPARFTAETGSNGFARASVSGSATSTAGALAGAVGWQRATGIDSFDGNGDRDGYRNLSARLRGTWNAAPGVELGASGFLLSGRSEYDGVNLLTFRRADTLDVTRNGLGAGRAWAQFGRHDQGLSGQLGTSYLASSNRNLLASDELNRTRGRRWTADGQLQYRFAAGPVVNTAVVAVDHDREWFRASDVIYGGFTNQKRDRTHSAITAEWRAEAGAGVLDLAVRRDSFSDFDDVTTVRASALAHIGAGFSIAASYGEGIAQPTFFDLYGFFPGNFVGNPALRPESSRGVEASLRYRAKRLTGAVTAFRQRLRDEIVDVFDPATFQASTENQIETSRRWGVEAELAWTPRASLNLSAHYAYLEATEPGSFAGSGLGEARRPKHSGSVALDGASGRFTYGAALAYSGARADTNFDVFPAERVRLGSYWLAGARVGYTLRPGLELFARGSNLFDARYQEAFGYRTEGRTLYFGVKVGG